LYHSDKSGNVSLATPHLPPTMAEGIASHPLIKDISCYARSCPRKPQRHARNPTLGGILLRT
ncbi:MAG: hypothetical protein KAT53_05025, partial [Dehalococcoidia bacterium]|nr:hypothetical protein [Dehalococcoidia bacterium]